MLENKINEVQDDESFMMTSNNLKMSNLSSGNRARMIDSNPKRALGNLPDNVMEAMKRLAEGTTNYKQSGKEKSKKSTTDSNKYKKRTAAIIDAENERNEVRTISTGSLNICTARV